MVKQPTTPGTRFSATVRLQLVVAGEALPLSHASSEWVIASGHPAILPGIAELVMHVDDRPTRSQVEILPHAPGSVQVPIRVVA